MGSQGIGAARLRSLCRYEKLSSRVYERRCLGLRLKGIRVSRPRKLTLKVFSVFVLTRRVVKMCSEVVNRMSIDHGVYPSIIFTSHWGFPTLSHSSLKCGNKRVLGRS